MKAVVLTRFFALTLCVIGLALASVPVHAGTLRNSAVGGVSIDAQGQLNSAPAQVKRQLRQEMLTALQPVPGDLATPVKMRKVSLRGLNFAVKQAVENNGGRIPDTIKYLAGLQRIEYVFVDEANNDVILAGPAEGWTVDASGTVVGVTTGRPVLLLDDLMVALQTVEKARRGGITCSIDPTEEGRRNLNAYLSKVKRMTPQVKTGVEAALGPQKITLSGVPQDSHFARVLVGADFRMKRIAMHLDPSPVRGLPSYLDLLPSARAVTNATPRWWLACNYQPMARSEDSLAWQLRGPGVKAMTEDEFIAADGSVKQAKRTSPLPQKWADMMTAKYEDLSAEDKVFGELRNVMDMCVIAALLEKEQLLKKAKLTLDTLKDSSGNVPMDQYTSPKTVPSFFSAVQKGSSWVITASGGVDIDSWKVASQNEKLDAINGLQAEHIASTTDGWWWN